MIKNIKLINTICLTGLPADKDNTYESQFFTATDKLSIQIDEHFANFFYKDVTGIDCHVATPLENVRQIMFVADPIPQADPAPEKKAGRPKKPEAIV